jgi:ankyrin repeat protein
MKRGDIEAVRQFLFSGGSPIDRDSHCWTPLAMAAQRGNTPIIELLLDAGADVNAGWPTRNTPLIAAAMAGSIRAVELLLSRGAKTDAEGLPVPELLRNLGYEHREAILINIQRHRGSAV